MKIYDLEARTAQFAHNVRRLVSKIPKTIANMEDGRQLIRSSGSVGANNIEANESLGRKDLRMRVKISRKEAKESAYWLVLLDIQKSELDAVRTGLVQEARELVAIFTSILGKL